MPPYGYSSLLRPGSIRLLRLVPDENEEHLIRGQLFEYSLQEPGNGTHRYEALSYAWGGENKPESISIDGFSLLITANLHTALLYLRDL